jgi:hypothetical protein
MNDQPLDAATAWGEPARANLPEYTVSELSQALKRSIEENFSHVRVRGEISGYKRHSSGHCYLVLKDADAALDARSSGYSKSADSALPPRGCSPPNARRNCRSCRRSSGL